MPKILLASDKEIQLNSSKKEDSWGIALSELPPVIDNIVSEGNHIKSITLKFSGKIYNNNILPCDDEYVICGLTNNDSDAATNTSGGTGGTNLFKLGPLDVGGRKTVNYSEQSIDITKYFKATSPHSVQNTSYSRLSVAFTSQNIYTKDITFSLSLDIATEAHSHTSKVTTAATCTSAGVKTYTCSCGDSYTESILALGHSWKTATYTWSSDGKTCTAKRVCGNNSSHTESATATITSAVRREATCTEKGTTRYTAKFSVSWASTQTKDVQDIAAKGHTWKNATCIAPKSCTVCDATEGSALGHSYTGEIKSNGNGEDATHSFKCVNGCNQYGGAVKHTWNDGVITKQPTCLSYGIKTYSCTVDGCGGTYTKTIPAKGHTEVTIPAVEPTCTATGLTAGKKCSVCNTILVAQQTVPALGHSPSCYPEITSVQMLYSNKQISASNKVPAGEYFRIVVGAIAHH